MYRIARVFLCLFSSPELKAQVSFSDHLSSVVCLSVRQSVRLSVRPSVRPSVCKLSPFSSSSPEPISTKLDTKYPWVKEIQVCSNEGPRLSQRGDNWEIIKINWQLLKIFYFRTTELISTKLVTVHPWVKGTQVCSI